LPVIENQYVIPKRYKNTKRAQLSDSQYDLIIGPVANDDVCGWRSNER